MEETYGNGIPRRGLSLHEIENFFPIGSEVNFLISDGCVDKLEVGFVSGYYVDTYFPDKYWFVIVSNEYYCEFNSHICNTDKTIKYKRNVKLSELFT